MSRTLIKTPTAGWFAVAGDIDGKKVRRQAGDEVITMEEYRKRQDGETSEQAPSEPAAERSPSQERAAQGARGAHEAKAARKETTEKKAPPMVTSETGKVLVGATTTIKCQWKDPDTGKVCGRERVIKKQDAFQVKYCAEHQKKHRLQIKRKKLKQKRAAAKAALKKAA